jgi:hypothetical protein
VLEVVIINYTTNNNCKGLVHKFKKVVYALKQAQRVWNERYDIFFLGLGFRKFQANPYICTLKIQDVFSMVKTFSVEP